MDQLRKIPDRKPDFAFGRAKVTYQFNVAHCVLDLENVRDSGPIVVAGDPLSGKAAGNAQTGAPYSIRRIHHDALSFDSALETIAASLQQNPRPPRAATFPFGGADVKNGLAIIVLFAPGKGCRSRVGLPTRQPHDPRHRT